MKLLVGGRRAGRRTRSSRSASALVSIGLISALLALGASPASAANGTLQGTVTSAATAQPLTGVEVRAFSAAYGTVYGTTTTNGWGGYAMTLPAGSYRLRFASPAGSHQTVYSGGSATWVGSSTVSVPSNGTLTYPMAMTPTATLGGTITHADTAAGLTGMTVEILDPFWGTTLTQTTTGPSGTYTLPLDPGTYRARVTDPAGNLATTYSGSSFDWASSTTITTTQTGPNILSLALVPKPTLTGTVTNTSATPLDGITVEILDTANWPVATTTTSGGGRYSANLAPGAYKIRYTDPTGTHATQYTGNKSSAGASGTLDVLTDTTADIALPVAGTLEGEAQYFFQPFNGDAPTQSFVVAVDAADLGLAGATLSDADGDWQILGLPPGNYKVVYISTEHVAGHPQDGHRPIVVPNRDILTEGLGPAVTNGASLAVVAGGTTQINWGLGEASLTGWDCGPELHQQYAGSPTAQIPIDLSGQDLTGANLRGCTLWGADLSGADLTGADLSQAPLWGTDLTNADLTDARLDHSWLEFPDWGSPPTARATMDGTIIAGASFVGTEINLHGSLVWTDPDWRGADFTGARMSEYDLSGQFAFIVDLFQVGYLDPDSFDYIAFGPRIGYLTIGAAFDLRGVVMTQGSYIGNLIARDLSGFVCIDCKFRNWDNWRTASFPISAAWANLSGANLTGAQFYPGSNLQYANLLGMIGNPSGGGSAKYKDTVCPDGTIASPSTPQTTCVGHGMAA